MQIKCPVCKKMTTWEENPYKPFCSERCKLLDLGKWAMEQYRVPADNIDEEKAEEDLTVEDRNKKR